MKKLFFIISAMLIAATSFAQMRGDMYVGGTLGIVSGSSSSVQIYNKTTIKSDPVNSVNFSLAPEFGYFVIDNLKVGAKIGYGVNATGNDDIWANEHNFIIGPNVAYYLKLADRFYYVPEIGLYASVLSNVADITSNTKTTFTQGGINLAFNIGSFEFMPAPNWGINFNLLGFNFNWVSGNKDLEIVGKETYTTINSSQFNFNLCAGAMIGVRYYF